MDRIIDKDGNVVGGRFDLDLMTNRTADGRFNVTYAYVWGAYDEKSLALWTNGLSVISPAIKGYLCCDTNFGKRCLDHDTHVSAATDMDSLTIPESGQVALVKKGLLSNLFGIQNVMDSHRKGVPYTIDGAKDVGFRDNLYDIVKSLEKKNLAFITEGGMKKYNTAKFDEGLPAFMFSDDNLAISAKGYGRLIHDVYKKNIIIVHLDEPDVIKKSELPMLTKVRIWGPIYGFNVDSVNSYLADNDVGFFGVRLESTEPRRQ